MEDRIRSLVAELFRDAPRSGKTLELRDEMEQNLLDRYNDLISEGRSPDDAFEEVRSSVGDMGELFEEIERSSVYERRAYGEPERTPEAYTSETTGQGSAKPITGPNISETSQVAVEPNIPEASQSPAQTDVQGKAPSAGEAPSVGGSEPPHHGEPDAAKYGAPTASQTSSDAGTYGTPTTAQPPQYGTYGAPTASQPPYYGEYGAPTASQPPHYGTYGGYGTPTASPPPDARYGSGAARESMPAKRRRKIAGSLIGAMWCLITALYFIVSFATGWWHLTWTMFLLGAGLSCIISYFAGERGSDGKRRVGALNRAMWCLITALYFIMSFQTGAWGMTWLIFLVGACLSSIVGLIASKGDPRAMWRAINGSFWSIVVLLYLAISFATGLWHLTWVIFLVAAAVTNVMHIFRGEKE